VPVIVHLPAPLRAATEGKSRIELEASWIGGALAALEERFPALRGRLRDAQGQPLPSWGIYVNGQDIRLLGGIESALSDGDVVALIPPLSGGQG
jgi:sulfur-carrier protein